MKLMMSLILLQVAMGNTDSHSSFVAPAKSSCSRFSSRKEAVPSARSWWKSNQRGSRSRGRSQHTSGPPFTSWHYEPAPIGARGGCKPAVRSPQRYSRGEPAQGGCRSQSGGGRTAGEPSSVCASLKSGGSPKVLLSKDGSMRVEFSNTRVIQVESQALPPIATTTAAPVADSSLHTSKGSSLSSEGSWYDSPWGTGGELADNVFACGRSVNSSGYTTSSIRTEETCTSSSYNTFFSTQVDDVSAGYISSVLFPAAETGGFPSAATSNTGSTEDSGIGDSVILLSELNSGLVSPAAVSLDNVYMLPAFPTSLQQQRTASTSSALLDDIIQEKDGSGGGAEQRYSSSTLPCRRAEPVSAAADRNSRKDFLKSRIRRLSDWTGSLSRKKRRIQVSSRHHAAGSRRSRTARLIESLKS